MPESVIGRMGRWCFRRWWWVLAAWAVAIAAGVLAIGPVFDRLAAENVPSWVESVQAREVLNRGNDSAGTVVGVVDGVDATAPQVRAAVTRAAADLAAIPGVRRVDHPYLEGAPARTATQVATDRRAVLVSAVLAGIDRQAADAAVAAITARLRALPATLPPGATVEVGGGAVVNREVNRAVRQDLQTAEMVSLPITLLVLVLVFGGLVAAGLPVLAAAVSVASAMTVLLGFSTFTDIDQNAVTVVTLLGLGLSVDYGLLLVARYREEIRAGHPPDIAVARAWATAGRTILFSALTVAVTLIGLLMFDLPSLDALGASGVSVAVVCMLAALTFTAALLGLFRRRVARSPLGGAAARWRRGKPDVSRSSTPPSTDLDDERGFFAWISRGVQRRPVVVAVVTGAALLAAGAPLLTMSVELPRLKGVPRSIESARVADTLESRFGRTNRPVVTVVSTGADAATLDGWAGRWRDDPAVARVLPATATGGVSSVDLEVAVPPQGPEARDLVRRVRADRPPGGPSWVTGDAAVLADLLHLIGGGLPAALVVSLVGMVALLFAMTGSLVVPVKAILANAVSLGAAFGVMTAVFGHGFASGLLDTLTVGSLNPFVMVVVFAFAFGLSMDYEVFLLGRVKEYVDRGLDTDTAVRRGLQHTGRVITSAALLMVVVFGCFAAARIGNIEQIGLGLTVAVLIDATVVRCLLVPATMTLLGRWNWWAPGPLKRVHARLGLREQPLPEPGPAPAPAPAAIGSPGWAG